MRIHYVSHAPFEKLGAIETWVKNRNYQLTGTHTYRGEGLPNTDEFDFLIVMGGPQSPLHIDKWPYLKDEMNLIEQTVEANIPLLGVCLGAQLIGQALGAKAEHSPQGEIGIFPIELLPEAAMDPVFSQYPKTFSVMHWHNDMPGLPKGARLLAKSDGCPRQAFSLGDRIYGLQFHLEIDSSCLREMILNCEDDLKPGMYIESKEKLLDHDLTPINARIFPLLDYLSSR